MGRGVSRRSAPGHDRVSVAMTGRINWVLPLDVSGAVVPTLSVGKFRPPGISGSR